MTVCMRQPTPGCSTKGILLKSNLTQIVRSRCCRIPGNRAASAQASHVVDYLRGQDRKAPWGLLSAVAVATASFWSMPGMAYADSPATLFSNTCAGCHAGGKNVQGGPTLFQGDLEKNGLNTKEGIYNVVYFGKNKMPGYGIGCAPKGKCTFAARLSDEQIEGLSAYVLQQASNGWK